MKKLYTRGYALHDLMLLKGYTNSGLAKEIDVTNAHLSNVRNGKTNASVTLAKKLADFFDVTIEDLFELKEVE